MSIVTIHTSYLNEDYKVVPATIEVSVINGIGIHLVGIRDECVKTSLLRIVTAMQSSGYMVPGKKVIINVNPAIMNKKANVDVLDLPIAIGIIMASGQTNVSDDDIFAPCGELGLDGIIRHPLYNLNDAVHRIERVNNK